MNQICIEVHSSNFTPQVKQARTLRKFLTGNWFHVTLRVVSPIICKQC